MTPRQLVARLHQRPSRWHLLLMLRVLSFLGYSVLLVLSLAEVFILMLPLLEHLLSVRPIFLLL